MPTLPGRGTGRPAIAAGTPPATGDLPAAPMIALVLLMLLGAAVVAVAANRPLVALGLPFLGIAALYIHRRPHHGLFAIFLLTGFVGTISSYTPLPAAGTADALLVAVWVAVLGDFAFSRRRTPKWMWPALLGPLVYVVLTVLSLPFSGESLGHTIEAFRLSTWYMAAALLIAFAPWPPETLRKIAKAFLIVIPLVGTYCFIRYFTGSSASEQSLAEVSAQLFPGQQVSIRYFGSFVSANQLAAWGAAVIPFTLAVALGWRGVWRLLAVAGLGLAAFAVFASDVRAGMVAAAGGSALVIGIYTFARSFPTTRVAHAGFALLATVAVGVGAYSLTIANDPESVERFENILNPTNDFAYAVRENVWSIAWDEIEDTPWGHGIGTSGSKGFDAKDGPAAGVINIDSTYLKIALEQGLAVMVFFAAGLAILALGLAWRAITVVDRDRATLAMGAAGTLAAWLFLFYVSIYIESLVALTAWLIIGLGAAQFTAPPRTLGASEVGIQDRK